MNEQVINKPIVKPYTYSSCLLEFNQGHDKMLFILPNLFFELTEEENDCSMRIPNIPLNLDESPLKGDKASSVALIFTDDEKVAYATHCVSLGYWVYRVVLTECTFKVVDENLIVNAKHMKILHQRPDR